MSEQNTTNTPPRKGPSAAKIALALALLLIATAAVTVLLARGSSSSSPAGAAQGGTAATGFYGTLALPRRAAPPIALRNYLGRPVTLAQYRGRAVLVTFIYTHCPDVCPLMVSNLRVALNQLGPQAGHAEVIAISVDPGGDTSAAVARFLAAHEMVGHMQYLIGSRAELRRTWSAWSVGASRQSGSPDLVEHSALVYGISAGGELTTLYPSSFEPAQIVHDVPRLAGL